MKIEIEQVIGGFILTDKDFFENEEIKYTYANWEEVVQFLTDRREDSDDLLAD